MSGRVVIAQSDTKSVHILANLFTDRGDNPQSVNAPQELPALLTQDRPALLVIDLHLVVNGWQNTLQQISKQFPETKILFTSSFPDPLLETQIKERYQNPIILRQPFTRTELEQILQTFTTPPAPQRSSRSSQATTKPKVRMPVRIKITLPYILLALILAMAAAYVVSQVVLDTIEERFTNQLIEAGKLTNDWMVQEEDRLLETLRLVAHTRGLPAALVEADAEELRQQVLPVAINYQEEAVHLLDMQGTSVLSLHHRQGANLEAYDASRGDTIFSRWDFVQPVLNQESSGGLDKYAGLARAPWGHYLYVTGPIVDDQGQQVGVVLVGKSVDTLVRQIRQDTLAQTTIYDLNGRPLASTLLLSEAITPAALGPEDVSQILARQDEDSLKRPLTASSINYTEILSPWEVRKSLSVPDLARSNNDVGILGAGLAETFLARPSQITRLQVFFLTAVTFIVIILLGVFLANRITGPLLKLVRASTEVAEGNLDVQVQPAGNDEVAVLAHSFNQMVSGLREGSLYRDLLGRTVSPEVREELRRSFASGELRLEGQDTVATVLVSDIRGFTRLSETEDPTTILTWLNEYFGELIPIITAHGGVISKLEGDTLLAFFGILPRLLPPQESASQACRAALAILAAVESLNDRRAGRNEPSLTTGLSLNTGPVTAGGLGSADRLHYTIIGDTVNTTELLEGVTRQFGEESSAVISQHTLFALRDRRQSFDLESLGVHNIRGKEEQLLVYRLCPVSSTVTYPETPHPEG